jgi:hypothetical protein
MFFFLIIVYQINVRETECAIKNGHSRETGNIWVHKTKYEDKQSKKHNTICVGYHYAQTNNVT